MEFFNAKEIDAAMLRIGRSSLWRLGIGVDVARFGTNFSVIFLDEGATQDLSATALSGNLDRGPSAEDLRS